MIGYRLATLFLALAEFLVQRLDLFGFILGSALATRFLNPVPDLIAVINK